MSIFFGAVPAVVRASLRRENFFRRVGCTGGRSERAQEREGILEGGGETLCSLPSPLPRGYPPPPPSRSPSTPAPSSSPRPSRLREDTPCIHSRQDRLIGSYSQVLGPGVTGISGTPITFAAAFPSTARQTPGALRHDARGTVEPSTPAFLVSIERAEHALRALPRSIRVSFRQPIICSGLPLPPHVPALYFTSAVGRERPFLVESEYRTPASLSVGPLILLRETSQPLSPASHASGVTQTAVESRLSARGPLSENPSIRASASKLSP